MSSITKFRHQDRKPSDRLLRSDPMPKLFRLNPEARLIYLRIIDESAPGVLLQIDRFAVELAAMQTAQLLSKSGVEDGEFIDDAEIESLKEFYGELLLPDLGQQYISQILRKG